VPVYTSVYCFDVIGELPNLTTPSGLESKGKVFFLKMFAAILIRSGAYFISRPAAIGHNPAGESARMAKSEYIALLLILALGPIRWDLKESRAAASRLFII